MKLSIEAELQKNFIERAYRLRTYKAAFVYNKGGGGKRACILRNISETGALLQIEDINGLPRQFTVGVELGSYEVAANWIWRKDVRLGVQFQGPHERLKTTRMQVLNLPNAPILTTDTNEETFRTLTTEAPAQMVEQSLERQQQANLRKLKQRRSQGFGKR
ncbi:MAG: PilZ domain-containing protein [Lentilitoribacter sp.]